MRGSISRRLLAVTVGVISAAVAVVGGFLLRQHRAELTSTFESGSVVLARAVAQHAEAPLIFDDAGGAGEILSKLERNEEVARAVLYDRDGHAIASYSRPYSNAPVMPVQPAPARIHRDGYLHVFEVVTHRDTPQGTIYLAASTAAMDARISAATRTIVLSTLAAIVAAAVLAWFLHRRITSPILRLAETMGRINDPNTQSMRVNHVSDDEIGVLYQGFNRMLDQLAARESERDRSTARLRALIAALPDPVFVLEGSGRVAEVLAGSGRDDEVSNTGMRGRRIEDLIGAELGSRLDGALAAALSSQTPQRFAYERDLPAGRRWYDAVLVPLQAEQGGRDAERLVLFVPRDVTERHSLELDLRQVQKMEALGRLAGGVAHDFNNILTAIMGYGSLLVGRLDRGGESLGELAEMMKAAERAAMLTQQLLAFSRRQMVAFRHVSLNEVVGDIQRMLERIIGEDVQLHADLAAELPMLYCDPGQLQQVILNLAVNAREAMPQGGTLTISTRAVSQAARRPGDPELTPGRYVLLRVSDTGVGMDESVRVRIFEPFFTTKGRKGGTGLGLATVYGIVRQAGGDISVASEPNRGTTFNIYLPEAPPDAQRAEPASATTVVPRGTETILVVEDEPQLLELTCRMLSEQGYEVLAASDARQALQLCNVHPAPIHLLVTDVVMPRMGGGELVSVARPLRPSMKVLFMSGYTDGMAVQYGVKIGQVPFLQKPFTPQELNRRVRQALGEVSAAVGEPPPLSHPGPVPS